MNESRKSPYDWKFPVKDSKIFAGRLEERELIRQQIYRMALNNATPISIAITGERRVGKTSLILRVEEMCKESSLLPIHLVVEENMVKNTWEFWHELVSRMLIAVTQKGLIIQDEEDTTGFGFMTPTKKQNQGNQKSIDSDDLWFSKSYRLHLAGSPINNPATYLLEHEFKAISEKLIDLNLTGLVLILDEAQNLMESRVIIEQLRSLIQQSSGFGIVFAGTNESAHLFNDPSQPFYEQITSINLRNFSNQDDITMCVLLPLSEEDRTLMSPTTVDHVARLSQGKPNQIRLICDAIYNRYVRGEQKDLDITIDVLDDIIDAVADGMQDRELKARVNRIMKLTSVELEFLYLMTRYPKWSIEDILDLDESFRGEGISSSAINRRRRLLNDKYDYFKNLGIMNGTPETFYLIGGEFLQLYIRFLYEIRKFGELRKILQLGKGLPSPFGEKAEKLVSSMAYSLGKSPELVNYVTHQYYRDEGNIVETVIQRLKMLSRIVEIGKQALAEYNEEQLKDLISNLFETCRLIKKLTTFEVLIIAIRNLENPRELIHLELYFEEEREHELDLSTLSKIVTTHAQNAKIAIEGYDTIFVKIPDIRSFFNVFTNVKYEEVLSKIEMLEKWKLASVRHLLDERSETVKKEEKEEKEEKEDENIKSDWVDLYKQGDLEGAIKYINNKLETVQKRQLRAQLFNDLGYIESAKIGKDHSLARRHLENALSLHYYELSLTLLDLAVLDIDEENYQAASKKIENALMISLHISEIEVGFLRLRLPENHLGYRVKWEQSPANVLEAGYINLAFATLHIHGFEEARKVIEEGIELIPSSTRLKHAMARLLVNVKRADLATPIYQELKSLDSWPDVGIKMEVSNFSRHKVSAQKKRK